MRLLSRGVLIFILILCLSGCEAANEPVTKTDFVLDTVASIAIYDPLPKKDGELLLEQCFSEIRRYEDLFSAEKEGSDVSRINEAEGEEVHVSHETAELVGIALKYCELSEGAFDITIRPVSKLWDFKSEEKQVPESEDIEKGLKAVGYEKVILDSDKDTVRLKDPEAGIDLGGIAKGYIADRIKEYLKEKGIKSAIINLGGNVLLIGSKPGGRDFVVGIEKPFGDGEMADEVSVSDISVVTSGNYERYFYSGGRLYHHILDTKTGYPAESGLNGVKILSKHSADGDALSTALFSLGKEKGESLIRKMDDELIGVYYIDEDNVLTGGNIR